MSKRKTVFFICTLTLLAGFVGYSSNSIAEQYTLNRDLAEFAFRIGRSLAIPMMEATRSGEMDSDLQATDRAVIDWRENLIEILADNVPHTTEAAIRNVISSDMASARATTYIGLTTTTLATSFAATGKRNVSERIIEIAESLFPRLAGAAREELNPVADLFEALSRRYPKSDVQEERRMCLDYIANKQTTDGKDLKLTKLIVQSLLKELCH